MVRNGIEEASIQGRIERHTQFAMIIVAQGYETKGLQACALELARRLKHFGHSADGAGTGMKGDFHEITGREFLLQLQHAAGNGDGLNFCACPLAAFGHHCCCYGSVELYTRGTPADIALGEVGHTDELCHRPRGSGRLRKRVYTGVC